MLMAISLAATSVMKAAINGKASAWNKQQAFEIWHFTQQGKSSNKPQFFDIIGFTQEEKENVYKITAAVMHMGAMAFKHRGR